MGLYLCIFKSDNELDGIDVGSYADYGRLLDTVTSLLENDMPGSRFPTLILHSDCDGEWSPKECKVLQNELYMIAEEINKLPAVSFIPGWQQDVATNIGLKPASLCDTFIDIDGEPLLKRLHDLCVLAITMDLPILFQ